MINFIGTAEGFSITIFLSLRVEWMYDFQGMVIMAANQVWWTWEVEDVFRKVKKGDKMGMKNYAKKLHSQIDNLVVQVRSKHGLNLLQQIGKRKARQHYPLEGIKFIAIGTIIMHGHVSFIFLVSP